MLSIPKRKFRNTKKRPKGKEERKQARRGKDRATPRSRVGKKKTVDKNSKLLREFHSLKQKLRAIEKQ